LCFVGGGHIIFFMCGIYGIWHTDGRAVDLGAVRRAVASLRHRGPDDEGYLLVDSRAGRVLLCGGDDTRPELGLPHIREYTGVIGERFDLALGFRRLSILDLSPAGHQPMPSEGRDAWLIFNGEVYNYVELRAELAAAGDRFVTGTDSEVILAAYRRWGTGCFGRFNGMWALALWDAHERRLVVSRDRFGVKPMYTVSRSDGTFAFGSEIKSLLAGGVVGFSPSGGAVARYVAEGAMPSHGRGDTFFNGVQALPGGHYAVITKEGRKARRFWSLPVEHDESRVADREAVARYGELFTDAVRLRLRADVPVGTCLSGGLDSSSIVAVAGRLMQTEHAVSLERLGEHQQTFSAVYRMEGPWDERRYIEQVVESTGAAGNYVYPSEEGLWDDLERLVWHQDEPFQSTSIFAQWCVMRLARERGVTVLLDGQGADEVLGGYRPFAVWLGQLLRAGGVGQALREARRIREVTGLNPLPLLVRGLAGQLPAPILERLRASRVRRALDRSGLATELEERVRDEADEWGDGYSSLGSLNKHLARQVLEDSLPTLLRYEDRNSMAFSIEARVPFLDYRLVEYVFMQAPHLRLQDGWTKWIQRQAVAGMLPEGIVWRRDKVGFETPERQWLEAGKERLMDLMASGVGAEYLDLGYVRKELPGLLAKPGGTGQVWRWANLVLWLGAFGGGR
jgi:asparagine synthase (glutamine-hydrolysing)